MMISDSFELFEALNRLELLEDSPFLWWPHSLSFSVVVSAILVQNSRWDKVEHSLEALDAQGLLKLERWKECEAHFIESLIQPSGLYCVKASYLVNLTQSIEKSFGAFEAFQEEVDRAWLLDQKGIGKESADAILCYACGREVMVVDRYTQRFLAHLGLEYESYEELQSFLEAGIFTHAQSIEKRYALTLFESFARFHGMFVEAGKRRLTTL